MPTQWSAPLTAAVGDPEFWSLCTNYQACFTRWDTDAGSEGRYNVQDIEQAKALISEAGVEGMKVRVMQPLDMPVLPDLAAVTAEVLEELGFDVDLQPMDWATLGTRRADPELWEAFHTWSGTGRVLGPLTNTSLQKDGWFNRYQDTTGRDDQPDEQIRQGQVLRRAVRHLGRDKRLRVRGYAHDKNW